MTTLRCLPVTSEEEAAFRWESAKQFIKENRSGAEVRSSSVTAASENSSNRAGVSGPWSTVPLCTISSTCSESGS